MMKRYLFIDLHGEVREGFTADSHGRVAPKPWPGEAQTPVRTIVLVPTSCLHVERLSLPGNSNAQDRAIALSMLSAKVSGEAAEMHMGMSRRLKDQPRWVALVSHDKMRQWMTALERQNIVPDEIWPDAFMAPMNDFDIGARDPEFDPEYTARIDAVRMGNELLLRARDRMISCQVELAPVIFPGADLQLSEDLHPHWLGDNGSEGEAPDLLSGGYRSQRDTIPASRWRGLAVAAAIALIVVPLVSVGLRAYRLHSEALKAEAETLSLARAALPKARHIIKPVAQMREKYQALNATRQMLGLSGQLFSAIEPLEQARLTQLIYTEDATLRVSLRHRHISELDRLEATLKADGILVYRESSRIEGEMALSDLTLRRRVP